jgi:tetratricopeptide (TPR) repeat protein
LISNEAGALAEDQRGIEDLAPFLEEGVPDAIAGINVAILHQAAAGTLQKLGRHDEALKHLEEAEGVLAEMAKANPSDQDAAEQRCRLQGLIGQGLIERRKLEEAGKSLRSAVEKARELAARVPDHPDYQLLLASSLIKLAGLHNLVEPDQAVPIGREAVWILEEGLKKASTNQLWVLSLANANGNLALTHLGLADRASREGGTERALRSAREALRFWRKAVALSPSYKVDDGPFRSEVVNVLKAYQKEDGLLPGHRIELLRTSALLGEASGAFSGFEGLLKDQTSAEALEPGVFLDAARSAAEAAAKAGEAPERELKIQRCLEWISRSVAGFRAGITNSKENPARVRELESELREIVADPAFSFLKDRKEFQTLAD